MPPACLPPTQQSKATNTTRKRLAMGSSATSWREGGKPSLASRPRPPAGPPTARAATPAETTTRQRTGLEPARWSDVPLRPRRQRATRRRRLHKDASSPDLWPLSVSRWATPQLEEGTFFHSDASDWKRASWLPPTFTAVLLLIWSMRCLFSPNCVFFQEGVERHL